MSFHLDEHSGWQAQYEEGQGKSNLMEIEFRKFIDEQPLWLSERMSCGPRIAKDPTTQTSHWHMRITVLLKDLDVLSTEECDNIVLMIYEAEVRGFLSPLMVESLLTQIYEKRNLQPN